jgi:hypothetical protein
VKYLVALVTNDTIKLLNSAGSQCEAVLNNQEYQHLHNQSSRASPNNSLNQEWTSSFATDFAELIEDKICVHQRPKAGFCLGESDAHCLNLLTPSLSITLLIHA